MFKRILLVVCTTAAFFSSNADMMLYTFEGSMYSTVIGGISSNTSVAVDYQFVIDFDEPGLLYNNPTIDVGSDNYGSVVFGDLSNFYLPDNTASYYTSFAKSYSSFGIPISRIEIQSHDENGYNANNLVISGSSFTVYR